MPQPSLTVRTDPAHPNAEATDRHVFVYGTLRRGDDNDITRLHPAPVFVGLGQVTGTLYHLGRYPGLLLGKGGPVIGEVYAITPALERVLDEIEECYPQQTNEYFKRSVAVAVEGTKLVCLVYEINPVYIPGKPVLAGGDWVKEREPHSAS